MYMWFAILGLAILVYGLIVTFVLGRKYSTSEGSTLDKEASMTTVKHPLIANPILIIYAVVPVLALLVGMLIVYLKNMN